MHTTYVGYAKHPDTTYHAFCLCGWRGREHGTKDEAWGEAAHHLEQQDRGIDLSEWLD